MGDSTNPVPEDPLESSASEAERQRIRELSRFYGALRHPGEAPSSLTPALSSDITLNALAQLAVFRFGCKRSFISLIDGQNQHIIAETTSSVSLTNGEQHGPDDGIYLGVSTLDLAFGVCPYAVKLFTGQPVPVLQNTSNMVANSSRFIVRDFSLEEHFRERPYVVQWPFFRFYAEVPVYSPSGYVLGSFCVVDDKPRRAFGDDEVLALQDISNAISKHLENVRTVQFHERSDRLVHGLKEFVKHRPHHRTSTPTDERGKMSSSKAPSHAANQDRVARDIGSGMERMSIATKTTNEVSPVNPNPTLLDASKTDPVASQPTGSFPSSQPHGSGVYEEEHKPLAHTASKAHFEEDRHNGTAPLVTVTESAEVSNHIASIFGSASSILRECMDLDGVLFLDASRCNAGVLPPSDAGRWEPLPKTSDPGFPANSSFEMPISPLKDTPCQILGFTDRTSQPDDTHYFSPYAVPELLLKRLVAAFPRGEVFNFDDALVEPFCDDSNLAGSEAASQLSGNESSGTDGQRAYAKEIGLDLKDHFPRADSVIFLPLWDLDKAQWLAGTFLWTRNRERALGVEELHYFKVFSDSLTSEVARVNWSRQERSKSNFISSLSHELRSPLHGMLASAELLSATPLRPDQQDFLNMLQTCGHTLLDTMNHLLDFAKINNLTTAKNVANSLHKTSSSSMESAFQLDALVEEVANTIYLGKMHATASQASNSHTGEINHNEKHNDSKLSVVVRIDRDRPWRVQSITGAWRRIVMNLLGNALKYTDDGFIEVCLSMNDSVAETGQAIVQLSITDTGRGISPEYLRHKLFSPFVQEDHISEGVGLGLCIVQQLVTSLHGSIDVKSELGVGTQINVFVPVQPLTSSSETVQPLSSQPTPNPSNLPINFCLVGFDADATVSNPPTSTLSREVKRRLSIQNFFSHLVTSHKGWSLSFANSIEDASGDVAIVEASALQPYFRDQAANTGHILKLARFILLSDTASSEAEDMLTSHGSVLRITNLLCPNKTLESLKKALILPSKPQNGFDEPLPFSKTPPPVPTVPAVSHGPKISSKISERKRVLIADDNAINVKVLSMFMKKLGWTYETASDGLIAVSKHKESSVPFDVILMGYLTDISMPVMDGVTATRRIRKFEKQMSQAPVNIIAVTGVASAAMKEEALAAGVNSYMIKPLSLQQLKSHLDGLKVL
ncbi:hypothetical protein S7711_05898 [Stachybotrys chartarum IBT 7711]|uniref:Histidine kinase n=1 Tax=Stachybotrys chartarum (strain CBS 109288 / IBT 7711) TaxID=1280523 RepID=A0A084B177_STACB|nr:hypothetical protein S7711_05898 [Stachybotrys chartarum IBT 7711]